MRKNGKRNFVYLLFNIFFINTSHSQENTLLNNSESYTSYTFSHSKIDEKIVLIKQDSKLVSSTIGSISLPDIAGYLVYSISKKNNSLLGVNYTNEHPVSIHLTFKYSSKNKKWTPIKAFADATCQICEAEESRTCLLPLPQGKNNNAYMESDAFIDDLLKDKQCKIKYRKNALIK